MGYDRSFGTPSQLRFGPYLAAALGLGLVFGLAMPVSAGVPSDANAPASLGGRAGQALPREAAKASDSEIVVADKHGNNNNKNWNKNWNHKNVVVVRPYRHWNKRAYYGTVIGGVALGTVLGAAAYSAVAPAPNLCWYWADPSMTRGYWDYC
jgi:hypothetical protein